MRGTWGYSEKDEQGFFMATQHQECKVLVSIRNDTEKTSVDDDCVVNFATMEFKSKKKGLGLNMKGCDMTNSAQLLYFIRKGDAQPVRIGKDLYIQAGLTPVQEDNVGHGKGYVDTNLSLYNVSETIEKKKKVEERESIKSKKRKSKKAKKSYLPEKNLSMKF